MHQSVKLTDAIWLLQQVISPLIHALVWPERGPHGIRARVANMSYPSPIGAKCWEKILLTHNLVQYSHYSDYKIPAISPILLGQKLQISNLNRCI